MQEFLPITHEASSEFCGGFRNNEGLYLVLARLQKNSTFISKTMPLKGTKAYKSLNINIPFTYGNGFLIAN